MPTENDVGQIVQAFACATLDPEQWMPALKEMSTVMGSASASLEVAELNTGEAVIHCTFPLDGGIIDHYEERIFHINPRVRRARQAPVGALVDDRSLMVDGDPHMGEFLDWLRQTPNRYVEGAKLLQTGGHEIYFGSYFAETQGPPEAWHRDVHQVVIPHLVNFVAAGRTLSANKLNNELITISHIEGDRPFGLLDRAGLLIQCSAGFEAILKTTGLLTTHGRRMVAVHAQHRARIERFLESALNPRRLLAPPLPIRLATPDFPRGLILRAIPIEPGNDVFDVFRPVALVTLTDLDHPQRVRCEELVELFDLTPREAEIAALIGEGLTPELVADNLRITIYTVRQHLKAVFSKMGTARQSELVAIVSRLF